MGDKFTTITGEDWARSIAHARKEENDMRLIIGLLMIGTAKLHASDDLKFLEALAQVESGGNPEAVGPCGSAGLYQIHPKTWASLTERPFSDAKKPLRSQIIALKLLQRLKKEMGTEVYWTLACGWKFGAFYHHKIETNEQLTARLDYANRVCALFNELKNKSK